MKYLHQYALLLLLVGYTSIKAQNNTSLPTGDSKREIKDTTTAQGPKGISRTIKQDRNGNIWIAAFDGVFRYDGNSFINVLNNVSSVRFFSVLEDRKGNFWFSSVGSGVYYYDGKTFKNFTTIDGLPSNQVIDIYEDKSGNIWFGTLSGVSLYNARLNDGVGQGIFFQNYKMMEGVPASDHNDVNSIIEDRTGKFWIGTRGHACIYDGKTFTVLIHEGNPFTNVRKIIEDRKGSIWLGGSNGLWRYDGVTFINFTCNFVGYIYEDRKGNIWTSSQNFNTKRWSLSCYDETSLFTKKPIAEIKSAYEDNKGMIFGILEATDGTIWFGGLDGVHRYDGNVITGFKK